MRKGSGVHDDKKELAVGDTYVLSIEGVTMV